MGANLVNNGGWRRGERKNILLLLLVLNLAMLWPCSTAWSLVYDFPLDFFDNANDGTSLGTSLTNLALGSYSVT